MNNSFRLFALNASRDFGNKVAFHLDVELSKHVEENFKDGEPYVRSDENVRNCDVFIIQSLYGEDKESVSDKFTKLLFMIGSLKDASARRVCVVTPFLAYSRQDRKSESRAPIHTRYVAQLLEAVGCDRVLTMDAHNLSAEQNAFRIPFDNLEAKNLLADWIANNQEITGKVDKLVCLSPDGGGAGRTKSFRSALSARLGVEVDIAYMDKTRSGKVVDSKVIDSRIIGDVKGKLVVTIDDMISSGSTVLECHKTVEKQGGQLWAACATHPLFVGKINENLSTMDRIIVTDTIKSCRLSPETAQKVHTISVARLFALAIRRTHDEGGSISDLLK